MDKQYNKYESHAEMIKAMAHPMRLCILSGLNDTPNIGVSEMIACLNVPQSTLSQQLSILRRAGLIKSTHKGKYVEYALTSKRIAQLLNILFEKE